MKKVKLSEEHADLIKQNMADFQNIVLAQVASNLFQNQLGGTTKPHSKTFGQCLGWQLSI